MLELGAYTGDLEEVMSFDTPCPPFDSVPTHLQEAKLLQIKSLGVLMSVLKGVVVPMFFSA